MKHCAKFLIVTGLCSLLPLALVPNADAGIDLVVNGDFTQVTSPFTLPSAGSNKQITAGGLTGWVNNTQIPTTPGHNSGVGYNFIYTQIASPTDATAFNGHSGTVPLWNPTFTPTGADLTPPDNIGLPFTGYTGNIIGMDGAYQQGPMSQTISGLTANHTYALTFYFAGAQQAKSDETGFNGATTEQLEVTFGSAAAQKTQILNNGSHGFTGWNQETMDFKADASSDVLSFLSLGTPSGVPPFSMMADVSLEEVPEASTVFAGAFMLLPVGLAAVRMWRNHKTA